MKLDTRAMRYLTAEDWRVLTAVEMGSKNHELVPTTLIEKIARLKGGASGVHKSISNLAKVGLIARMKEAKYDGYRLSYGGLDYLALHTHASRKNVYSVGSRIGVGKESDIMIVADDKGTQKVLKIHRLGRISFRTVKTNRDYLKNRQSGSWMYLSRLAAIKEYAFMQALREEGFPVPEPIAQSRHTILMTLIDAPPMRQISSVPDPAALYAELISLILRLAKHGLIHGDFNEFNILIREDKIEPETENDDTDPDTDPNTNEQQQEDDDSTTPSTTLTPILIDFPQMVSMDHQNAEMYFDRDVECVKRFFSRRFHFTSTEPGPFFKDAKKTVGRDGVRRLDAVVEASGFTKKMAKDLEAALREQQANAKNEASDSDDAEDESEEEEEDEDEDADEGHQVIGDQIVTAGEGLEKLAINDGT
ncbi:Rio2, N-terminal-domain-containing protein [Chaetomium fimeti]|uniref:Serine/threonine-protein kinase RIO2 n=1 Tax=Chaetomium fimeti TaxID=1854472 RepID=A0AAE0HE85_9PEZI|nr:Rio2, N-terminal-domain-containing protein [Chaetomium fimeti]